MTIAFFCAGTPTYKGTDELLNKLEIEKPVKELRYRGYGWPGKFYAKNNAKEASCSYDESWGTILNKNLLFRCKICPDGIGMFADLSVGDAWDENDGLPNFNEKDGFSLVLSRTRKGLDIYEQAKKEKVITSEYIDTSILNIIQKYQIFRKRIIGARILALRLHFKYYPRFIGFSKYTLLIKLPIKDIIRNFWGMLKRL